MEILFYRELDLDDVLLYAMQGCYLLHVPTDNNVGEIHTAYIEEGVIVLANNKWAIVIRINPEVGAILKEQQSNSEAMLAVLIAPSMDDKMLGDLSFATYANFSSLANVISEKEYQTIISHLTSEIEEA